MTRAPYVKRPLTEMMNLDANTHRLTAILHAVAEMCLGGENVGHYTLIERKGVIYTSDEWMIDSDEKMGMIQAIRIKDGKGVGSIEFSLGIWQMAIEQLDYVDPEIALRAQITALSEANDRAQAANAVLRQEKEQFAYQLYNVLSACNDAMWISQLMAPVTTEAVRKIDKAHDAIGQARRMFPKTSATPLGTKEE